MKKVTIKVTQKRLKKLLTYNPKTGLFTRNVDGPGYCKGQVAGTVEKNAYVRIGIDCITYTAHNLAFLYMKGYLPEGTVDHIDRVRHHNWWSNLREVGQVCNIRNTPNFSHNTSGVKGVTFHKGCNKWQAQIKIRQRTICIKQVHKFEEAVCYRLAMEQCVGWSGCDSNSPAYQYVTNNIQGVNYGHY